MTHVPSKLDIATDLRRCIYASYGSEGFDNANVKTFLEKAMVNLEFLKDQVDKKNYLLIKHRLAKAKDPKNPVNKRREDLLTATYFL